MSVCNEPPGLQTRLVWEAERVAEESFYSDYATRQSPLVTTTQLHPFVYKINAQRRETVILGIVGPRFAFTSGTTRNRSWAPLLVNQRFFRLLSGLLLRPPLQRDGESCRAVGELEGRPNPTLSRPPVYFFGRTP